MAAPHSPNHRGPTTKLPVRLPLDPMLTLRENLSRMLRQQKEHHRDHAVAQHLVGAKLELRFPPSQFPHVHINRDPVSAADASAMKPGDFLVGDTVFHVTVSPSKAHFDKCEANLRQNLQPMLLVPDALLSDVAGALRLHAPGRVDVQSIESFVSQNIGELAVFSKAETRATVHALVQIYNHRIETAERGKPYLKIDPASLG